ncbi:MAG: nucleotidyltransferase family protein [Oscillospiraceae bacterium]|nr:nucleotidyltransferase family protein [Oscillospiraceae bacterium]
MAMGCIVMAAGAASRFGGDKLAALFRGKPLLRLALEAVPVDRLGPVAVVTGRREAAALAGEFGFLAVDNAHPDWGISHTIRLGLDAVGDCGAAMFLVADQPLLRRETAAALADLSRAHPDRLVGLAHGGVRGNPCIFPARFFPALRALRGDRGGGAVIRRHMAELLLLEAPACELADVDTLQALEDLERS